MGDIFEKVYDLIRDDDAYGEKFFASIVIVILCFILIQLIKKWANKWTSKEKTRYRIKKISYYLIVLAGIGGIFYTWFNALDGLMAAFSIVVAITFFAMKDLVLNLAGFAYITAKKPFSVGDRIEIKKVQGDVIDINLFQITLAELGNWLHSTDHTGRVLYIPNQEIFSNPIANYSSNFPYIWRDIIVPINHGDNIEKMMSILEEIGKDMLFQLVQKDQKEEDTKKELEKLGNRVQLFDGSILPKVHIRVHDSGVDCYLRYLSPYRGVSGYETEIWKRVLKAIENNKDLSFSPTAYRLYSSKVKE